jgi:Polysaccharide pyruvyl transferase
MWFEDKAWRSAAQWVIGLSARCDYVLAPQPLQNLAPRCLPLEFSYCIPDMFSCAIVFPKDEVDRLSLAWIRKLKSFPLLYIDDVFVVLSTVPLPDLPACEESAIARETPYLWNKVDAILAGTPIRTNSIDASLSTAAPGDPYCLIVNACLAGNAGEKLLAAAARELVARVRPDLRFVVADPDVDRSLIAGASLVVLGPGGMLYDLVDHAGLMIDFQNIANYFRLGYIARDYERPFCILGIAQQSKIVSRATLDFVRGAVSDALFVTTRDSESVRLFIESLDFRHPVVVTPDVCVTFSDDIRAVSSRPSDRRSVVICGSFGIRAILVALKGFTGETRFVLQGEEDASWFGQHKEQLTAAFPELTVVDIRSSGPEEFFQAVASADAIITTRFHTMMIGIIAGIDTVVLGGANDKRHRVCAPLAKERWIRFVHSDLTDADALQSIIRDAVKTGQRKPGRGIFNQTHLDEICGLLQLAAMRTLPAGDDLADDLQPLRR